MAATAEEHPEHPSPEQQQDPPDATEGNNGEKTTEEAPLSALPVWPPSQRAREAVIQSLVESLSSPSGLFNRYGAVPHEEAAAAARSIEQEAFAAVSTPPAACTTANDDYDGGMETLNTYSKEISKRVVAFCKARQAASSPPPSAAAAAASGEAPPLATETSPA